MLLILALAIIWDLTLSEPPIYIHPVVWTGKISEKLIKNYMGYLYGILIWIISVIPVLLIFTV
ncbi:MAG: cobalamin biosynthesis protein, partial [Saccharolobus sp.]